jgi:hypothetical protein
MKSKFYLFAFSFCLWQHMVLAHDVLVHHDIAENAAASARTYSSVYRGFFDVISSDCDYKIAVDSMLNGSEREDDRDKDEGGKRSLNHFYDPLTGLGLSNIIPDDRIAPFGRDSLTWASTSNCPGVDVGWPISNKGKYNIWSCKMRADMDGSA